MRFAKQDDRDDREDRDANEQDEQSSRSVIDTRKQCIGM